MAHRNARLTPHGRLLLCRRVEDEGWKVDEAAAAAGVSRQTAGKWLARWRAEGAAGLPTAPRGRCASPCAWSASCCAASCCCACGSAAARPGSPGAPDLAPATVYRALRRHGLHRLRALEPREPVVRYCWPHAGDLVHLDTKKLGRIGAGGGKRFVGRSAKHRHRGIGWNYVHVAVDDATRLAYAEELPDERGVTAAGLPRARPGLLRGPRDRGAASAHRQRQPATCSRAFARPGRGPRPRPLAHAALPAADQRQGGGVREDRAERLGLQAALRLERRERIAALPALPALLQWLPTAWRSGRRHTAGQAQVNNLVMQNSTPYSRTMRLDLIPARCCAKRSSGVRAVCPT